MAKQKHIKKEFDSYEVYITVKGEEVYRNTFKAMDPLHAMGQAFTLFIRHADNRSPVITTIDWKQID